jgi:hypothetical protein
VKSVLRVFAVLSATAMVSALAISGASASTVKSKPATNGTSASIVKPPVTDQSGDIPSLCDSISTSWCLTMHTTSPYYVFLNIVQPDSSVTVYSDGWTVTSSWPFNDTTIDKAIEGHTVWALYFPDDGLCAAASSSGYIDGASYCGGSNTLWVQIGCNSAKTQCDYESVGASNLLYADGLTYPYDNATLCNNGANNALTWDSYDVCESEFLYLTQPS